MEELKLVEGETNGVRWRGWVDASGRRHGFWVFMFDDAGGHVEMRVFEGDGVRVPDLRPVAT